LRVFAVSLPTVIVMAIPFVAEAEARLLSRLLPYVDKAIKGGGVFLYTIAHNSADFRAFG
jgi:hypothetical protein